MFKVTTKLTTKTIMKIRNSKRNCVNMSTSSISISNMTLPLNSKGSVLGGMLHTIISYLPIKMKIREEEKRETLDIKVALRPIKKRYKSCTRTIKL